MRRGPTDLPPAPPLPPSPLAGEGRGEGACSPAVIPDVSNAVIPDVSNAVIPDVSPAVIPDVLNRESTARVRGLDSRRVQQPPPAPPAQNGHDDRPQPHGPPPTFPPAPFCHSRRS